MIGVLASSVHVGGFVWAGDFTTLDLIAASTNALNGALLARRPDHFKNFTIVGVILMAVLGGIGGGVTRDGRPMLGRKLKGKSKRELRDLGLLVEEEPTTADG